MTAQYQSLGQPCRNFNILGIERIDDPRDGREKVVLSNFASGAIGNLVLLDPASGEGEAISLPADNGAWAVLNLANQKLLVGTCPEAGMLHCLDLARREWAPPLRDPHETYIWNLCLGSDGMVYGGTYPGCALLRYDPQRHTLDNLGRLSANPGDLYSRTVYGGLPGYLLIACGYASPHLVLWDIAAGAARPFGKPGAVVKEINARFICTETAGALDFYDTASLAPLDVDWRDQLAPPLPRAPYAGMSFSIPLRDGTTLATRGQDYYIYDGRERAPALKPIPTPRPPTRIHTITSDARGRIWGSAAFGQTIFCFDPASGDLWNSPVVCDSGGEVYGMCFSGERLFMSAYSGGDHIVYDPALAWTQAESRVRGADNVNPRTLSAMAPDFIRPATRSLIGPDGAFWTGWWAGYGTYGGALSRVDVDTLQVRRWDNPIPSQALVSLAADNRCLYFATGGVANGLPEKSEPLHFVVCSPEGKSVWQQEFAAGQRLHCVAAAGGLVALSMEHEIRVFDPEELTFQRTIALQEDCHYALAWNDGALAAFCGHSLWRVNLAAGECRRIADLPGEVHCATRTPDGRLFFACDTTLYQLLED